MGAGPTGGASNCCTSDWDLQGGGGVEIVKCHEIDQKFGHPRCWRGSRGPRVPPTCGSLLSGCAKPLQFPRRRLVEFEEAEWLSGSNGGLGELSTQERNARLQDLVRAFVLRASAGVPCQIVDAITGYGWPARYTIDSRLQQLSVEVSDQMHWTCRISDVQHVRVWQEDSKDDDSFFPLALRKLLPEESMRRLVMLEQKDGSRLCLLEKEAEHAEELRVAVSILGLYTREQGSAAQQPAAAAAAASKADAVSKADPLDLNLLDPPMPLKVEEPLLDLL